MEIETPHLLHDITNCICAVVGAADTLAAHHDHLTQEQRELLAGCLQRQSDVLRTLLTGLREAEIVDGQVGRVERPDPRDTIHSLVDVVAIEHDAIVLELDQRRAR